MPGSFLEGSNLYHMMISSQLGEDKVARMIADAVKCGD